MIVNKELMSQINAVQYEIFKAFHTVCEKLDLTYYLVHGSLLGALKYQGFFPMDDDIDVAMPRKDYERLIREGQSFIDERFFIQSHISDKEYPLIFAKVRDNNTAFIQPTLQKCNINKGIYIDVFPIDNYPIIKSKFNTFRIKRILYSARVSSRLCTGEENIKSKAIQLIATILLPSWYKARDKYCELFNDVPYNGRVIVRGGKPSEVGIPFDLFGKARSIPFNELQSYAPCETDNYLKVIYGENYLNYSPIGKYLISEDEIIVGAEFVDVHKSYKEYQNKG